MKRLLILMAALLLVSAPAYAVYYNYGQWDMGYGQAYGIEGWVGGDGIDRIIFYAGSTAHIYQVTTDANPNLHPLNPDATGPIATRTFTYERSFALLHTNYDHECEFYVASDGSFYLGAKNGIEQYSAAGVYLGTIGPPSPSSGFYSTQSLAYDAVNNDWYAGSFAGPSESLGSPEWRTMYVLDGDNPTAGWSNAFDYPPESYGGMEHHDGLEMVGGNLLIADYAGQIVEYTTAGTKVTVHDHDPWAHELEGMGSGALGHYWGGTHSGLIFEFGGGSLPPPVPEPSTMLLLGSGLIALVGLSRKKLFKRG